MGKRLVAGLGNPGAEYEETRHNLGFRVVEELVERLRPGRPTVECNSLVWEAGEVLLVQPNTFMNRSGYALRCLRERRGVEPAGMLVVFDEVRLPLGKIRFRPSGGPGGHNGMASVIENMRTEEMPRLRLGVGGEDDVGVEELVDYVLSAFPDDERAEAVAMVERAADACECWLTESPDEVMQRFN